MDYNFNVVYLRNNSGSFATLAAIRRIGNHTFDLTQCVRGEALVFQIILQFPINSKTEASLCL
jgi:hypothetical protein